ncbi:antitoxin of toxin-antitoxin stability system [Endozoicomonas arenosclerae]|uniref:antitoxin of toxin-antitoxin stability system n=1 Tax=Endozoicomonas arenosclerae TaxID=1633495 RepID=UPI000785231F|nr:antitoxin of toxin-antitoxin stability system [Endozoicomonas arenosclerae]
MLQKVMCGYTTSISKFKANPKAVIKEAQGDAVAVSSNNEIQFYAVPAELFEEMINFCEYAQRGTTDLKSIPGKFSLSDEMVEKMTEELKNKNDDNLGEFIECENNT